MSDNPIRNPSPPGRAATQWAGTSTADAERLARIRLTYRGLQGDMPPFGDVLTLLRLLDQARAEIARLHEGFADINKSLLDSAAIEKRAYLQGAADMKEKLRAPPEADAISEKE